MVNFNSLINTKNKLKILVNSMQVMDGGDGSGNFGHKGRPGEVGGSSPNGAATIDNVKDFLKNNNITNKELMSKYSITPKEFVDRINKTLNGKNPVFSTEEKYNEAVNNLKNGGLDETAKIKIQKAVNRYDLINKAINEIGLSNEGGDSSKENKETTNSSGVKVENKTTKIEYTDHYELEGGVYDDLDKIKNKINNFANNLDDLFGGKSFIDYDGRVEKTNLMVLLNEAGERIKRFSTSKTGDDNYRDEAVYINGHYNNYLIDSCLGIISRGNNDRIIYNLHRLCDSQSTPDAYRAAGIIVGQDLLKNREKSEFWNSIPVWLQLTINESVNNPVNGIGGYGTLAEFINKQIENRGDQFDYRQLKRYADRAGLELAPKVEEFFDKLCKEDGDTFWSNNELSLIGKKTTLDLNSTFTYNDTNSLFNYYNSIKNSGKEYKDATHKNLEKEAINQPDIKNEYINTEMKNYKKSISKKESYKNLQDMLPDFAKKDPYKYDEKRSAFKVGKHEAIYHTDVLKAEDKWMGTINDDYFRRAVTAMTIGGSYYNDLKVKNKNGFYNQLNVVAANAPIRNDFLVRYENANDKYRNYADLKPGDTFEMQGQHFTNNPNFEDSARKMFGENSPVRIKVQGDCPFFSIEPYVWKGKSMYESEGLIAGPMKVVQNRQRFLGKLPGREIIVEYDWDKHQDFIKAQLKSLAMKNKMYPKD